MVARGCCVDLRRGRSRLTLPEACPCVSHVMRSAAMFRSSPPPDVWAAPRGRWPSPEAARPVRRRVYAEPTTGEDYTDYGKNPWVAAVEDRLSTFAADVDTASYTIARRKLQEGTLPPAASVRVEEWVNYFHYSFPAARAGHAVLDGDGRGAASVRRGSLRAARRRRDEGARRSASASRAHLVFLVDVSGSMDRADKLGLAKQALHVLTDNLAAKDAVVARHLRRRQPRRAADDEHRPQGSHPQGDRLAALWRRHRDGVGHRPRVRAGGEWIARARSRA